jgi:hypothetical protein
MSGAGNRGNSNSNSNNNGAAGGETRKRKRANKDPNTKPGAGKKGRGRITFSANVPNTEGKDTRHGTGRPPKLMTRLRLNDIKSKLDAGENARNIPFSSDLSAYIAKLAAEVIEEYERDDGLTEEERKLFDEYSGVDLLILQSAFNKGNREDNEKVLKAYGSRVRVLPKDVIDRLAEIDRKLNSSEERIKRFTAMLNRIPMSNPIRNANERPRKHAAFAHLLSSDYHKNMIKKEVLDRLASRYSGRQFEIISRG